MESDPTNSTKSWDDSDDDAESSTVSSNEDEQGNVKEIIDNLPPPATSDDNDDNLEPFVIEDYDEAIENLFQVASTEELEERVLLEYDIVRATDAVPPELQLTMESAEKRLACPVCKSKPTTSNWFEVLSPHTRIEHRQIFALKCDFCYQKLHTIEGLKRHMQFLHEAEFPTDVELIRNVSFTTLEEESGESEADLIDDTADDTEGPQPGPSRQCKISVDNDDHQDKGSVNLSDDSDE